MFRELKSRWKLFQWELMAKYNEYLLTRWRWLENPHAHFFSENEKVKKMKWVEKQIKKYYRLCRIFCKGRNWRKMK